MRLIRKPEILDKIEPSKERLLRKRAVLDKTGLSHAKLYVEIREGKFPRPVDLGPKSVAWVESEIDEWIAEHIARRDAKHRNGGDHASTAAQ
jgi:prophage regulatory protein